MKETKARIQLSAFFVLILLARPSLAQMDFSHITPPKTAEEAAKGFAERARLVTEFNRCQSVEENNLLREFVAIAKLESGGTCPGQATDNITMANDALLRKKKDKEVGSEIPGCRTGDYDMGLVELTTLAYRYGPGGTTAQFDVAGRRIQVNHNRLRPEVYDYLLNGRGSEGPPLSERGPHKESIKQSCCHGVCIPETENHILMIETSRYLANQLLLKQGKDPKLFDNRINRDGDIPPMNEWMLSHLQQFLKHDFQEYNARPYAVFALMAIQNLYEFAEDDRVKLAAQMILDYQAARFAVSSNGLRRIVPFRRRSEYKDRTELIDKDSDAQTQRFIILSGLTQLLPGVPLSSAQTGSRVIQFGAAPSESSELMQIIAVGSYRVPSLILDLAMNKSRGSYYQRFYHSTAEVYWSEPEFLISAGGFWNPSAHSDKLGDELNCYADAGWAQPTTLMPSSGGLDYRDFIRIDGDRSSKVVGVSVVPPGVCRKVDSERVNTCVAPGFACGLNPIVPTRFLQAGVERPDNRCTLSEQPWTFIDGTCSGLGFYAAVYGAGQSFGFFEAASPRDVDFKGFAEFRKRVLERNGGYKYQAEKVNDYVTVTGRRIQFIPKPDGDKYHWGIVSYGDPPCAARNHSDIARWPLAEGDIVNSVGNTGYITIDNPFLKQRLILDLSNVGNPRRELMTNDIRRSETEVWVDFGYRGQQECGTVDFPFKTLSGGMKAIPWNGAVLRIKAGSGSESIRLDRNVLIKTSNGPATIGRP